MSENTDYLIKNRGYKRAQVTKLQTKVTEVIATLSLTDMASYLAKIEQLGLDLRKLDSEVGTAVWKDGKSEELLNKEFEECDMYQNKVIEVSSLIKNQQSVVKQLTAGNSGSSSNNNNLSKLKLPEVPIPFYSHGKDESLAQFLKTFEEIVSKYPIGQYKKFILFKDHLKGEPLTLVKSLEPSRYSYEAAKKLLQNAFECEISNKFDAIARLSKIDFRNYASPYEFVGEMRTLMGIFHNFEIDVESVLQFFFWKAIPGDLQTQLITISNNHKPSLDEINDNIFKALHRYNELSVVKSEKIKKDDKKLVNNFAVNLPNQNKKSPFCTLCSKKSGSKVTSHYTKDCPEFPDAESKVKQLKLMNACTLCGYANHSTANCHFKFHKNCLTCGKEHMSFLCIKGRYFKNDKGKPKSAIANTADVWSVMQIHVGSDCLLPTFHLNVKDKNIRAMKDSGCQPNFIKTDVADKLNLTVIQNNFPVTVNGFNESQNYITKVVEVPVVVEEE